MDASKLLKFKDMVSTINQMNGGSFPLTYLIISNDKMTCKSALSMYDLHNFDYLIAIGDYIWQNGPYTNKRANLLGFFNKDLELVESIPLNPEVCLKGIDFTNYPSSYYNYYDKYKPIFLCERLTGESLTLKMDDDGGWSKEFVNLFNKAKQL